MTLITSTSNSLFKRIRKLEQKKFRKKESAGFIDGLRPVLTVAEEAPHLLEKVIVAPDLLTGDRAESRLAELVQPEQRVEFSADLFRALSDRDNPAGLGAIVRSPLVDLSDLAPPTAQSRYLILDRIGDPGNLGTMIRTADAAGFSAVLLVGTGVDVLHPSALKASLGTAFTLPICQPTIEELKQWKEKGSVNFVGTSAKADFDYANASVEGTLSILLGNEREGLSAELTQLTDIMVSIPMHGQASSLNVAIAAGILMYQFKS